MNNLKNLFSYDTLQMILVCSRISSGTNISPKTVYNDACVSMMTHFTNYWEINY